MSIKYTLQVRFEFLEELQEEVSNSVMLNTFLRNTFEIEEYLKPRVRFTDCYEQIHNLHTVTDTVVVTVSPLTFQSQFVVQTLSPNGFKTYLRFVFVFNRKYVIQPNDQVYKIKFLFRGKSFHNFYWKVIKPLKVFRM